MDPVRPRSAHRKRRLFLFLARPGSSMGGLHRPRVRRGKSIRAGPLLRRPAVPRRGLLVLWPVYCVQERGRKVLVEIPLPRRSLLPLAIRLPSSSQPLLFLAVVDHGSSVGHVRMVPSAEFRFSFSHARPVDCRPCRQLVRAWLQQETTVLAGFKFGSRTIKLKRLVLQLGRCIHVRNRGDEDVHLVRFVPVS